MTDPTLVRRLFRIIALAEACSWLGLLIGMYVKYVPETTELGVQVFGPIHGTIFLTYLAVTLAARYTFGWSLRTTALAGIASIPPFATALFEVLAERSGLFEVPVLVPVEDDPDL